MTDNGYLATLMWTGLCGLIAYLTMRSLLIARGTIAVFRERTPPAKDILVLSLLAMATHALFEMRGDFFWNVGYGSIFSAMAGLFCGTTARTRFTFPEYGLS